MGKLSFIGNFAAIFFVAIGLIVAVNADKNSSLTDVALIVVVLGPLTLLTAIVLGIIAAVRNKQRGWGIAGALGGIFLIAMFCLLVYIAMIGLGGFR